MFLLCQMRQCNKVLYTVEFSAFRLIRLFMGWILGELRLLWCNLTANSLRWWTRGPYRVPQQRVKCTLVADSDWLEVAGGHKEELWVRFAPCICMCLLYTALSFWILSNNSLKKNLSLLLLIILCELCKWRHSCETLQITFSYEPQLFCRFVWVGCKPMWVLITEWL